MGIVKSIGEIVRERMTECTDAGAQQFIGSIRPIYGSTENGNPIHIGTCILLQIENLKYLLTAAHVIDENEHSSLYVGGESEVILIEGDFLCTKKPEGGRDNDHYDFAWLQLSDQFIGKMGNVCFAEEKQFSNYNGQTEGRLYLALGYPNTKNRQINTQEKSVKPHYMKYASTVKPNDVLCKKLGVSGKDHLFLNYNPKHSKDEAGKIVNSIVPRGISGGALIDMGNIAKLDSYIPGASCKGQIAGMLIENHRDCKAMSAVKVGVIVEQIKMNNVL
jgi:hypothetical protein